MFHQQIPQLSNEPIPQSATTTNNISPRNEILLENNAQNKVYQDLWQILRFITFLIKKSLPFVLIAIIIYLIYKALFFQPVSGYIYHYEDPWWGTQMYNQVGIYVKIPFISRITRYNQAWTVSFGSRVIGDDEQILKQGPLRLTFSDSYTASMPATFRYRLSNNKTKLEIIHRDFIEFQNLVDSLLIPISEDVMVNTAMQYQGEEFFTGGLNQFKTVLKDQLQYGLYKSEPQDKIIGSDEIKPYKTARQWKLLKNETGEFLRMDNPLKTYGIEITQIDLGVPIPEPELQTLLDDKKRFDRIANEKAKELALVQEEEKIQLAQIEKVKKIQLAQIEKEQEIELAQIAKQQEIELAQIKKEQEIENAKGNSIPLKKTK
jgi:regulator of protease activity HflC (stomatin/prohibitin superfamily)